MKMEPIVSSETSAIRTQTPGNYPKRNNLQIYLMFNKVYGVRLPPLLGATYQITPGLSQCYLFPTKYTCFRNNFIYFNRLHVTLSKYLPSSETRTLLIHPILFLLSVED